MFNNNIIRLIIFFTLWLKQSVALNKHWNEMKWSDDSRARTHKRTMFCSEVDIIQSNSSLFVRQLNSGTMKGKLGLLTSKPLCSNYKMVPYLPVYDAHFFPLKKLGKLRCVLLHGILCFRLPHSHTRNLSTYDCLLLIEKFMTEPIKISTHFKLLFLFRWTTDQQGIHFWVSLKHNNWKKSEREFEIQYWQCGGLGRRSSLIVYVTFEAHVTETLCENIFTKENTNSALIHPRLTSVL